MKCLSYVSAGCTDTPHHVDLRDGVDACNIQAHSHSNWTIYKRQKAKLNSDNCSLHCNYAIMCAVICLFLAVKTSVKEVEYRDVSSLRSVILLHHERLLKAAYLLSSHINSCSQPNGELPSGN